MDEASNTAAPNSGEKQKFFAGSVTFCGQRYTCQCRDSSSKSASAVGVDAGHSRSRRRNVTDVGLPLAGTHRPGSLHRFSENLRRIRGCPMGRQSRRPLQRPSLSPCRGGRLLSTRRMYRFYGNLRRIRNFPAGRCGHRPLQRLRVSRTAL